MQKRWQSHLNRNPHLREKLQQDNPSNSLPSGHQRNPLLKQQGVEVPNNNYSSNSNVVKGHTPSNNNNSSTATNSTTTSTSASLQAAPASRLRKLSGSKSTGSSKKQVSDILTYRNGASCFLLCCCNLLNSHFGAL